MKIHLFNARGQIKNFKKKKYKLLQSLNWKYFLHFFTRLCESKLSFV